MGETRKPKPMAAGRPDEFQTDPWALDYLMPYLPKGARIWEPACGEGKLVLGLIERGFAAVGSDVLQGRSYFEWEPDEWDMSATNPPFSLKDEWIRRCYELGKPWALLLPLTTQEGLKRQAMFRRYGLELIVIPQRPTFTTPNGTVGGGWFPCGWFTWGLNVGSALVFPEPLEIERRKTRKGASSEQGSLRLA